MSSNKSQNKAYRERIVKQVHRESVAAAKATMALQQRLFGQQKQEQSDDYTPTTIQMPDIALSTAFSDAQ